MARFSVVQSSQDLESRVIHTVEMATERDSMPALTTCGISTAGMIFVTFSGSPDPADNIHLPCFN